MVFRRNAASATALAILAVALWAGAQATGYTLTVATVTSSGSTVQVPVTLVRPTQPPTLHPSTMTFTLTYDPALVTPVTEAAPSQTVVLTPNPNLSKWYGKGAQARVSQPGTIKVLVMGGTTAITTYDDQIPSSVDNPHTPTDQETPFQLFTLTFNVVGSAGQHSVLSVSELALSSPDVQELTDAMAVNGQISIG